MHTTVKSWMCELLLRRCVFELTTPQRHGICGRPTRNSIFLQPWVLERVSWSHNNQKRSFSRHGYFSKLEQFETLHFERGELYMEYRRMSFQERNDQLCKFCEKDVTTSATLPTRRSYPDYGKLLNIDWVRPYNSDKLSSLRVDELSL